VDKVMASAADAVADIPARLATHGLATAVGLRSGMGGCQRGDGVGILLLMSLTCLAGIVYFRRTRRDPRTWHTVVAPASVRSVPAGLSLPRFDGGRLVLAVDVSPWLRSDAPCSAERLFCRVREHERLYPAPDQRTYVLSA
jgi:hypothetical protein